MGSGTSSHWGRVPQNIKTTWKRSNFCFSFWQFSTLCLELPACPDSNRRSCPDKELFPWQSKGNLSLELGMQSFILGQRSKPRLFVLHCERLFYIVPIHIPSVQGMGTVLCASSHSTAGIAALRAWGTQSFGHLDICSRKRRPQPEHSLCHVNYCFYLKFHWQSRKMPFRQSKMPMHGGLLESIK